MAWVAGGMSFTHFIGFTDSTLHHLSPIPSWKWKKWVTVWGEAIWRGSALCEFSGKAISPWREKCDVEKGRFRGEVIFLFILSSIFAFPKKVAGICTLSKPCEPSNEPNPLRRLLTEPCWIYPALLSTYYLNTLTASGDYGCNSLWFFFCTIWGHNKTLNTNLQKKGKKKKRRKEKESTTLSCE